MRRLADGPDAPWVYCASQGDAAVMVGVNRSALSEHLNQSARWRRTQLVPGVDSINGFVVRRLRDGVADALRAASSGADGDGVGATVRPHLRARGHAWHVRVGAGGGDDRAVVEGEGGGGEGGGIKRRRDGDGGIGGTDGGNEPMSPAGAVAEVPAAPPAGRAPAKAKTPREATGQKKRVRPPRQYTAATMATAAERQKERRATAAAAVRAIEVVITDLLEKREERRRQHKRRQQLAAADGCAAVDRCGASILFRAIRKRNLSAVMESLAESCDTLEERTTNGDTPLHVAVRSGSRRIVRGLVVLPPLGE